jgi:Domain of unknown function (DUF4329)
MPLGWEESISLPYRAGICPTGTKNVGDYHTHGANDPGYDNENFSSTDKKQNDREGVPGFLGTPNGDIKIYQNGGVRTLGAGAK